MFALAEPAILPALAPQTIAGPPRRRASRDPDMARLPRGALPTPTAMRSASHFHITPRRILDRGKHAAAGRPRRDLFGVLCLDPVEPVGPPRPRVFGCVAKPFLEVLAARRIARPVLIFWSCGWIDNASNVARPRQHVSHRPAEER